MMQNLWWHILPDFINQQRIMGTAQHHSINQRVGRQKGLYILTDKIISARRSILVIFHYRGPHGAGMARDHHIGEEFAKFQRIRLRLDGAMVPKMPTWRVRVTVPMLSTVGRITPRTLEPRLPLRQILPLNGAQGLG